MKDLGWAASVIVAIFAGTLGCSAAGDGADGDSAESAPMAMKAGCDCRSGVATGWNAATSTVTVTTPDGSTYGFRYTDDTTSVFIGDPEDFPAGVCRAIAWRWEKNVDSGADDDSFRSLLAGIANYGCRLRFDAADTANADGSFDLISVGPIR